MANKNQVEILKQGPFPWINWRNRNQDVPIDLVGANFAELDLSKSGVSRVDLSNGDLTCVILIKANFSKVDFSRADLFKAHLNEATLIDTNFSGAKLSDSHFCGANISGSNFSGADLSGADLSEANLRNADLSKSDLRNTKGIRLDGNLIRDAQISPYTSIAYFRLLHIYSGSRFLLTLSLSMAAMLPYSIEAIFWKSVGRLQDSTRFNEVFGGKWEEVGVWEIVTGWDEGIFPFMLTMALICYNCIRAIVTLRVAEYRQVQEQSYSVPYWSDYRMLWYAHQYFLRWMLWLSITIVIWKVFSLLFLSELKLPA